MKKYGYGIVDRSGEPYWSDACVCEDALPLENDCENLNDPDYPHEQAPYRVVELMIVEADDDMSSQMVVRMENSPADLPTCPFCGGTALIRAVIRRGYERAPEDDPDRLAWYVVCHACAAQGGWAKSRTRAELLWKMRHALTNP